MNKFVGAICCLILSLSAIAESQHVLNPTTPENNRLGLSLIEKSVEKDLREGEEKNLMISPVSYYVALGMAYNGTAGMTREQMAQVLGAVEDFETFNNQMAYFQSYLERPDRAKGEAWRDIKPPLVGIYNSAWHTTGSSPITGGSFEFAQDYKARIQDPETFGAEVRGLEFKDEAAADVINGWAEEKTQGLIKKVINPDTLQNLVWLLMNATYLEANWEVPFDPVYNDELKEFRTLQGEDVVADMISRDGSLPVVKLEDGTTALRLDFYDRGTDYSDASEARDDLAFYIVLPDDAESFRSLRNQGQIWDAHFWADTAQSLSAPSARENVNLILPKFAFDYSVQMKKNTQIVKDLDINFLFQDSADFSAMAAPESVTSAVGYIKQDTRIELDENGVKAAAVTTIGGVETTSIQDPSPLLEVDRPFYFAIASKGSGTLLFLGQVVNPNK